MHQIVFLVLTTHIADLAIVLIHFGIALVTEHLSVTLLSADNLNILIL